MEAQDFYEKRVKENPEIETPATDGGVCKAHH